MYENNIEQFYNATWTVYTTLISIKRAVDLKCLPGLTEAAHVGDVQLFSLQSCSSKPMTSMVSSSIATPSLTSSFSPPCCKVANVIDFINKIYRC